MSNLLPGNYAPIAGSTQWLTSSTLGSPAGLTVPKGAKYALIQAFAHDVIFTDDGSVPSATNGLHLVAGQNPVGFLSSQLGSLQLLQSASGATVAVSYYG